MGLLPLAELTMEEKGEFVDTLRWEEDAGEGWTLRRYKHSGYFSSTSLSYHDRNSSNLFFHYPPQPAWPTPLTMLWNYLRASDLLLYDSNEMSQDGSCLTSHSNAPTRTHIKALTSPLHFLHLTSLTSYHKPQ